MGAALAGPALLAAAGIAVAALIVLIAWVRLNPFLALVGVSLVLALAIGMPPTGIVRAFEAGVGNTLGHIALVVGLGTMLGRLMVESGGADSITDRLSALFGPARVDWAMMAVALLVGLPVFFEVGFVLLVPLVAMAAQRTGMPVVRVGLSMAAGLSVVHALVPPHPAALLAVTAYGADLGRTIAYALLIGVPTALVAGPVFARLIAPYVGAGHMATAGTDADPAAPRPRSRPGFGLTVFTLFLPVGLMLLGGAADLIAAPETAINAALKVAGNSVVALLIATLFSLWSFGIARGFDRETILRFCNDSLAPTASVTLVVGAGAGFGRILLDGGVSDALVGAAEGVALPVLVLGWLVAALLRIATGSATVAMATASGIVAPIAAATAGANLELVVISTGAGAVIASHVNDGGFWLVKEYFGLSVADTLKTWTVCETVISVMGLALACALSAVL
jgi:gluconate:H+ symporter, GntP family